MLARVKCSSLLGRCLQHTAKKFYNLGHCYYHNKWLLDLSSSLKILKCDQHQSIAFTREY